MSTVARNVTDMGLGARCHEFTRVIESVEITDASGRSWGTEEAMAKLVALCNELRQRNGYIYIIGNGGSAGVAGHTVTDLVNVVKLRATTIHDPALLTCMSNDYGYESGFARILASVATRNDLLVAISSSGQSENIRNAVRAMRELGGSVVTLTGFRSHNPLRTLGDVNVWLDSDDYGLVEIGHQFILHNVADRLRLGL